MCRDERTGCDPNGVRPYELQGRLLVLLVLAVACSATDIDQGLSAPESEPTTTPTQPSIPSAVATASTMTTLAVSLPAGGPIFGEETGVLLLFDDGIDGVTAVDPDRRLAGRSVVEGQRAEDEPFSMIRIGDKLVVGWSRIHAIDIATREAISLGLATIFVPAAEPDRVWMINYPDGFIGGGDPEVWQVNVSGEQITEPLTLLEDGYPDMGVLGGLALQTEGGLELWNASSGQITPLEGEGTGFVSDVSAESLLWCIGVCSRLIVTDTIALTSEEFDPPEGYARFIGQRFARFSPDGRYLAAIVGSTDSASGEAVWILDLESGDSTVILEPNTSVDFLAWAPDGDQLFASSNSYSQALTVVWRYRLSDPGFTAVVLPFGGAMTPVVVDVAVAVAYIGDELSPDLCPAPQGQPSGRTDICSFKF